MYLVLGALLAACGASAESPSPAGADQSVSPPRLFVLGGSDPRKPPLGQVAAYTSAASSTNGSWVAVRAMGAVRAGGRAAALGGYVYHVGGMDETDYPYLNSTLRYDPKADRWRRMADIPCDPKHPAFCPDRSVAGGVWKGRGLEGRGVWGGVGRGGGGCHGDG